MDAAVVDVSQDGIALRLADPLRSGQSISLQIDAPDRPGTGLKLPPDHDREPPASEPPIRILAVVRYCRPEGGSYVLGCSFGADWAASLASEILPADMPALRKSA